MYVDPFAAGVLLTIIIEIVILFIVGFIGVKRREKNEATDKERNRTDEP